MCIRDRSMAVQEGYAAVVAALLEARAAVDQAKPDGATPLFMAAQEGYEAKTTGGTRISPYTPFGYRF